MSYEYSIISQSSMYTFYFVILFNTFLEHFIEFGRRASLFYNIPSNLCSTFFPIRSKDFVQNFSLVLIEASGCKQKTD